MPLQKQLLQVPLSAGLGQKEDVRGLQPVQAATMQNCVRLKNGAIRKRAGTSALSKSWNDAASSGTVGLCVSGGALGSSMWMADELFLYSRSDALSQWYRQCLAPAATALDRIPAAATSQNIIDVDWCIATNHVIAVVFTATDPQNNQIYVYLTMLDGSGFGPLQQGILGSVLLPIRAIATFQNPYIAPKVIACGNSIIATYIDNGGNLIAQKFSATSPTSAATTATLFAAANMSPGAVAGAYDVAPITGDATRFVVATCNAGPAFKITAFAASSLNATGTTATFGTIIDFTSVAVYATNGGYWWAIGGQVSATKRKLFAIFYNEGSVTTSTTTAAFFTDAGTGIPMGKIGIAPSSADANGDLATAIWSSGYANGTTAMQSASTQYAKLTPSGTTISRGSVVFAPNVQLASRPAFAPVESNTEDAYVAVYTPSTLQGTVYLAQLPFWSGGGGPPGVVPVVCLEPRLQKQTLQPITAGGSFTLPHLLPLPTIASLSAAADPSALGVQAFPVLCSTSTFHNAVALQPVDLFATTGRPSATLGSLVGIAGGMPSFYDGQTVAELGFCTYPEPSITTVGSGGNLFSGTYQYIVTYEWYDATGNVHRSATSPTVTVTTTANDSTRVVVPVPIGVRDNGITASAGSLSHVFAVIYRTTVGGSTFYRQTSDPPPAGNVLPYSANIVTITDTTSDATLTAGATAQILYTTGGLLDNFNPPSARCVVQHTQRWFLSGCDNPRQVWASKTLTDGEAPGFNEALAFFASGAVRAMASMDGNLILFVQRQSGYGIEYVTGQGPTDTGAQSDWSQPIPIPTNVGAVDQRGTCVGDFGCLFRSPVGGPNGTGGIFLLSRDLQVSYVSGPVEDLLAACPIVTSMVVHPNAGCVYITTITSDASPATTGGATRLVWDYLQGGIWSSDVLYDTDAAAPGLAVRAAWVASAGGVSGALQAATYHCASAGGRVYRENTTGAGAGAYLDAGSQWVTMKYVSAPLKPDLNGFARFWRLQVQADSLEAADLTVQLLYDFAPASYYQESHTWTAPQIATFDRAPQVDLEMLCGNQKSKAIQVVLTDATPTGGGVTTGQGMSWASLTLELGVKTGRYPNLPSAQRS